MKKNLQEKMYKVTYIKIDGYKKIILNLLSAEMKKKKIFIKNKHPHNTHY
jgi:hypothetical protein